MFSVKSVE